MLEPHLLFEKIKPKFLMISSSLNTWVLINLQLWFSQNSNNCRTMVWTKHERGGIEELES
jgi:hypothetical protein